MKTRIYWASATAAVALAFAYPAFAADTAQDFVSKAAVGGMFEVDSSKVALDKSEDQSVKDFAQKMIDDHSAANAKLETIAGEQKLEVPPALDAEHKADLDALNAAAAPVDDTYVKLQRDAHAEAVALFESYSQDGDNAALKAFASETLPTLKMHQQMVEKMSTGMDHNASGETSTTPAVNTSDTDNPAAPVAGANSFTEDQAKSRIEEAGYSDVTGLAKDEQGIWRGKAAKDGKTSDVALDFQGNVTSGTN
jgi:putative membrane protein